MRFGTFETTTDVGHSVSHKKIIFRKSYSAHATKTMFDVTQRIAQK